MDKRIQYDPRLDGILKSVNLEIPTLKQVTAKMMDAMERGLSDDPNVSASSSLKMLPSYVCELPDGTETGDHMALDLGGSHFRVLVVTLMPGEGHMQGAKKCRVPKEIMVGTGEKLFDYIAECLVTFAREQQLQGKKLTLGFTFSFPCRQEGLRVARLITWTKGYHASGVEGQDVAQLLQDAMHRRKDQDVEIDIVAVVNDTVGTLMAVAQEDRMCEVGVILGTGTNACYMETIDRCPKMRSFLREHQHDKMIINMEWGAFGDLGELKDIRSEFDADVDVNSINPGHQIFEKMISGMYLGEVARLILLKLVREKVMFGGFVWSELSTRDRFYSRYVGDIVEATVACPQGSISFDKVRDILKEFGAPNPSWMDCANVAAVCWAVLKRSAGLCAAGIAAILNRLNKKRVTIAIDGAVYRHHQAVFHDILRGFVSSLLTVPCEFTVRLSSDGSGRGAALIAAVASRLSDEKKSGLKQGEKKDACSMS